MRARVDPVVDIRSGLLWFAALTAVGAIIFALEPFGDLPGRTGGSQWVLGNSYLLALAPLVAIERAYRQVRSVPYSPRGLEERRTIGGRWMLPTCMIHATGAAGAFVWGDDRLALGLALTVLLAVSWFAFVEVQRRTRVPLAFGEWTSRDIDQLRVNSEALCVAMIWVGAGIALQLVSPLDDPIGGWLIGLAALGVGFAFIRVVVSLSARVSLAGLFALAYILGAVALVALASSPTWEVYLLVGVPLVALLLERARRQHQRVIAGSLVEQGHGPALRRRYGGEFFADNTATGATGTASSAGQPKCEG